MGCNMRFKALSIMVISGVISAMTSLVDLLLGPFKCASPVCPLVGSET